MAILNGTWHFNKVIDLSVGLIQQMNFYTGVECQSMVIRQDNALEYYSVGPLAVYTSNGWSRQYARVIFFTEPQEVSEEFYNWFTANATQTHQARYTEAYIENIADKIREKLKKEQLYGIREMADRVSNVYDKGKSDGFNEKVTQIEMTIEIESNSASNQTITLQGSKRGRDQITIFSKNATILANEKTSIKVQPILNTILTLQGDAILTVSESSDNIVLLFKGETNGSSSCLVFKCASSVENPYIKLMLS